MSGMTWQEIVKATWGGRDAHGAVPFDQKSAWLQGYDEAMRQVRQVIVASSREQVWQ